jgi:hypothetical protein
LGSRKPQRSLFEAQVWARQGPVTQFYSRMGALRDLPHAQWTGILVSIKRLFGLFQGDMHHMRAALMVTATGQAGQEQDTMNKSTE